MCKDTKRNYADLDRPEVLSVLFHPRSEAPGRKAPLGAEDVMIPVADDVRIGGCFHIADRDAANILFFHGNGEIAADYDDFGPLFNQLPANFLAVDYRGYGRSEGNPTVAAMMSDCHDIFEFGLQWLKARDCTGPLIAMGRSLGSASALELACSHTDHIAGLVIESGFAYAGPLLALLGIEPQTIGFEEDNSFSNLEKIGFVDRPTLVIHAEYDHIIPYSDGQALYDGSASKEKALLKIPGADHNNIFMAGLSEYLVALKALVEKVRSAK